MVRNTLVYALGNGAGILVTLFLTPLLITELGATTYGVWVLATSLSFGLGYLSLADLGIEDAAVRFIAQARAAGAPERVRAFVSSAVVVLSAVALALTPLLVLASGWLVDLFAIPAVEESDALLAFRLVALQLVFDLPARAFSALLQGAQDYGRWQAVEFARAVLTAVALAGAVLAGTGIVGMAVASLVVSVVLFAATAVVALVAVPSARPSPRAVDRATLRQMAGFSGQLTVFRLTGVVYRQTDRTIIGIALAASAVTTYEIANRVQTAAALLGTITTAAIAPAAAFHSASRERLRELLVRGTRLSVAASLPAVIAAGAFAEPLVTTWIGDDYADAAGPTRLFLVVVLLSAFVGLGQSVLVGMGRVTGMLWIGLVWVAINLPVSIVLAGPLGIEGVILGTVASQAITFP
ncbi:MAG TPA: oligosaccharide flippase family protein, partial [Capillimicrobium sp.]